MFLAAAPAALSQSAGYVPAMSNPYGITLDREWAEWAAKAGVSLTVAAALLLISRSLSSARSRSSAHAGRA